MLLDTAYAAPPRLRLGASLALAASALAALVVEQARRVAHARQLNARKHAVFTCTHPQPSRRVLLIGDSTGAGVGCAHPGESIAARLAQDVERAEVRNLCESGATIGEVLRVVRQLPADERFDLVLVFAGGNDVLKRTAWPELARATAALLHELRGRGARVVWAGMANVGLAPLFLPPFSWWMTARTRRVNRLLAAQVRAAGGQFVDFFRERGQDPFSADPARYYAIDRVHPSAQAYAWCYARMRPVLRQALATPG